MTPALDEKFLSSTIMIGDKTMTSLAQKQIKSHLPGQHGVTAAWMNSPMPGRILFLKRLMTCRTFCSHENRKAYSPKRKICLPIFALKKSLYPGAALWHISPRSMAYELALDTRKHMTAYFHNFSCGTKDYFRFPCSIAI